MLNKGVSARHIYNGGMYVNGDWELAALDTYIIPSPITGPLTETGGVVSRNENTFYVVNSTWDGLVEITI